MSLAIKNNKDKIQKMVAKLSLEVAQGKRTRKSALGIVCQYVTDQMVKAIDTGVKPANAPSTVAHKGSSKPLIDTGQLKNSIEWEIQEGTPS